MNIAMRLAPFVLAASVSSAAVAETVLNASTPQAYRASVNQMAVECDGATRGPCFLELNAALKKIETDYFNRFIKGKAGGTPEFDRADALRRKELTGLTRAEILRRAAALK